MNSLTVHLSGFIFTWGDLVLIFVEIIDQPFSHVIIQIKKLIIYDHTKWAGLDS